MSLIVMENLKKHYTSGGETVEALRGISLAIEPGEFIAIMGQSGSGKSTLLSILGGVNHPTEGFVEMAGVRLYDLPGEKLADFRAGHLGFVFQWFHLIPYLTALENVMLPLAIARMKRSDKRTAAGEALARVGLADKGERLPNQLSGGEQERVAIARAIVSRPPVILADEPTGNLDSRTGKEIMCMINALNAEGMTIVMVTHNPDYAAFAHRVLRVADGMLI
jgi:putative ABC transport system ATP-binding protein